MADTILEGELTDREVQSALESMVLGIRGGTFQKSMETPDAANRNTTDNSAAVLQVIRSELSYDFSEKEHPGWHTVAGVARSILGSIECHTTGLPDSRG